MKLSILAVIFSILFLAIKTAENFNASNDNTGNLRFLGSDCDSAMFGISWYSSFNVGTKLDKYTNTQSIKVCPGTGIAHYNDSYNYLTCKFYGSACGEKRTSNPKEQICNGYSKYERNMFFPDRIIYSSLETPDIKQISDFRHTIEVIVADIGSSSSLRDFYDKLPSNCKRPLNLTFDI
jgi:hypothetical protein